MFIQVKSMRPAIAKLQHPLHGKVNTSLNIYKTKPEESSASNDFRITIKDLLGNHVPERHNPANEIVFALADVQQIINSSIPQTTCYRATDWTTKLLKSTVMLDEEAIFVQRKCQQLAPIRMWK
ncbi:hypothetical protein L873DRAFT_1790428 [Choiromyces venosus 120613-1]|uniref:Uncharacterized protein n=1 Tax=Choiromyces venosus 120613-1 TaxID=1336337 RepID=A0A3N4JLY3_9PEZI|nr:hypothetical protein L873DRAFT_1790428 [Choiromyces venosus 120613-1]